LLLTSILNLILILISTTKPDVSHQGQLENREQRQNHAGQNHAEESPGIWLYDFARYDFADGLEARLPEARDFVVEMWYSVRVSKGAK
jgi:hypothetical protein